LRHELPRREPCGCRKCKQRTCSGLCGPWPRLAVELAGLFLWSLTFEVTPPAEAGAVSLVRDDAPCAADQAYSACRSGSALSEGLGSTRARVAKYLFQHCPADMALMDVSTVSPRTWQLFFIVFQQLVNILLRVAV
jgi:hypothetical protein